MATSWCDTLLDFYKTLSEPQATLPNGVEVMHPYRNPVVWNYFEAFCKRYYTDDNPRIFLIGINPGRFGAGVTGVPFTDPVRLEGLGIANTLDKRGELSSEWIYRLIEAWGGAVDFYRHFYITGVSPLGIIKGGKNLNYYDLPALEQALQPWMISCMEQQVTLGAQRNIAFSIGRGQNLKYLQQYNGEHNWFDRVEALPHPRWIMQYRRKQVDTYIQQVVETLRAALKASPKG